MNHTFTTKTWGGNKPVSQGLIIALWVVGVLLFLTIIGIPLGVMFLGAAIALSVINTTAICPSCKSKVSVFRNAKAFSCYACQSVAVKKNNQWEVLTETK